MGIEKAAQHRTGPPQDIWCSWCNSGLFDGVMEARAEQRHLSPSGFLFEQDIQQRIEQVIPRSVVLMRVIRKGEEEIVLLRICAIVEHILLPEPSGELDTVGVGLILGSAAGQVDKEAALVFGSRIDYTGIFFF